MVTLMSLCASNLLLQQNQLSPWNAGSTSKPLVRNNRCYHGRQRSRLVVLAITKGSAKSSKSDEKIPSWARPDSEEPPPWARDGKKGSSESTVQIPYVAYLLASAVTAIAAVNFNFCWSSLQCGTSYHGLPFLIPTIFLGVSLIGIGLHSEPFFFLGIYDWRLCYYYQHVWLILLFGTGVGRSNGPGRSHLICIKICTRLSSTNLDAYWTALTAPRFLRYLLHWHVIDYNSFLY